MTQPDLFNSTHVSIFTEKLLEKAARSPADLFQAFLDQTPGRHILNLGCGTAKIAGAFGVDIAKSDAVDLVHDLDTFPWPLHNDHFDAVIMKHVIEHLKNIPKTMNEILRVCKNGALVYIETPHYTNNSSWGDPCHHWHLNTSSLQQFVDGKKPVFEMLLSYISLDGKWKKFGLEKWINETVRYPSSKFWRRRREKWENRSSFLIRGKNIYFVLKVTK